MRNRVLIVDDSISICNSLKNLIEKDFDIDVYIAKSMKESATILLEQKGKFGIILADLGLPDAPNGEIIDFLSKFSIPIVVLTGTDDTDIEDKFRNKNIVDYIIKDGVSVITSNPKTSGGAQRTVGAGKISRLLPQRTADPGQKRGQGYRLRRLGLRGSHQ